MLAIILKSMSLVVLMRVGGIALQLLWFVLLVRLLPLEAVGVYSVINSIWVLNRALGPAGYDTAFIRDGGALIASNNKAQARGLLNTSRNHVLLLHSLLYIVIAAIAWVMRDSIPIINFSSVIWALLASYAYLLFGFYSASMLAMERQFPAHILESIALPLLVMGTAISLHFIGDFSIDSLITAQAIITITLAAIYHIFANIIYGKIAIKPEDNKWKETKSLAKHLFGTVAFNNLNLRLPVIISPLLIGVAGTALLEAALRFAGLLGVIQWCASFVIAPKLSKVDKIKDKQTLQELLVIGCWSVFIPAFGLFLILVIGGQLLLQLIAGEQYVAAYLPMIILSFGFLINTASGPTTHFYMMLGHEKTALKISATETIITICAITLLSQYYGIYGVATGMMLGLAFRNFWLNCKLQNLTGLHSAIWSGKGWKQAINLVKGNA